MNRFRTILFDIDGTLLDFHKTEREALKNTFTEFDIECNEKNYNIYSDINEALWKELEKGEINKDTLKIERFRLFSKVTDIELDFLKASEKFIDYLAASYFFIDGALDICSELSKLCTLAATTNGIAKVQHSRIKNSGLNKYFSNIFISDEIGFPKPHKEYFDFVFDSMKIVNLNSVLIVGDSLTSDIKGGNNAGIATCWYNPKRLENDSDSICNYEIGNLEEIKEIIF